MKIKEKEGQKYSLEPFEGYKYRAKFVVEHKGTQLVNTDIYTTNESRSHTEHILTLSATKNFKVPLWCSSIVHWASKEQDEKDSEFLDELLKDW